MRFLHHGKDGGPESTVEGWWLVELKKLFSAVLLKFSDGSRDSYHSHAFDSLNWVLRGRVVEYKLDGTCEKHYPSFKPVVTRRSTFHRVESQGDTWVLSLRGPWRDWWEEFDPVRSVETLLTHGRVVLSETETPENPWL